MFPSRRAFLCWALLPLLAACAAPPAAPLSPAIPTAALTAPARASATPQPSLPPSPTPWGLPERPQYILNVDIDYDAATLHVHEIAVLPNPGGQPLAEVPLIVEPRWLDAFELTALEVNGQDWADYEFAQGVMTITLPEAWATDAALHLELTYLLRLPATPGTLSATERQLHVANWVAALPAYAAGEGWLIHPPGLVGEHLVFPPADFDVTLRSDDDSVMLMAPGARTDLEGGAQFTLPRARAFTWSAGRDFITLVGDADGIPLQVVVYPEHERAGQAALDALAQAVPLYQELFGPYPHEGLMLVEASFTDGLESDAFFFLDQLYFIEYDGTPTNYLTTIAVHEAAHQWWYSAVGNNAALEPWLDEALCTFSELLFYENVHPSLVEWWWYFRIERFRLEGAVNSAIYDQADFLPYVKAVYFLGAHFLDDVRELIGEPNLLAALRDYRQRYDGDIASAEEFFAVLEEHSPVNLDNLRAYYFKP
ncbi:MAG: hypothetical protein EPO32_06060 [Anaerolineae bacterium]|nr:MAG: hypothetical protein EPO32_06060 [Anaerolineae bacterium]